MNQISDIVEKHEIWRSQCINLISSENILSNETRRMLASDMASRYTLPINKEIHGTFVENAYRGTAGLDDIEALANSLASSIFNVKHVTFAPLSGHIAAIGACLSLCEKGDTIMALASKHGGYDGYNADYIPDMLGFKYEAIPFITDTWNINVEATIEKIIHLKPKLVVLGASFFPFPHPVKELSKACKEVGAYLAYDGCHVLGLIGGGEFQDPLAEGADLLIGNTHKSFYGPQGGCLMTNDDAIFGKIKENLTWRTVDNIHWNRIAATAQALAEFSRGGEIYADQVVKNSKALAQALEERGMIPLFKELGYTASHQVILDPQALQDEWNMDFNTMAIKLETNNIITDAVGRLGTNEVTRLGMKESEMEIIAEFIKKALNGEKIVNNVELFRKKYVIQHY
ncbi:MAG: serine hydroxymethyltransferase [Thermoplasmata archaeon]|nr:serine hydroxymethyltransferase [Thermoplasmata archaeon]